MTRRGKILLVAALLLVLGPILRRTNWERLRNMSSAEFVAGVMRMMAGLLREWLLLLGGVPFVQRGCHETSASPNAGVASRNHNERNQ